MQLAACCLIVGFVIGFFLRGKVSNHALYAAYTKGLQQGQDECLWQTSGLKRRITHLEAQVREVRA